MALPWQFAAGSRLRRLPVASCEGVPVAEAGGDWHASSGHLFVARWVLLWSEFKFVRRGRRGDGGTGRDVLEDVQSRRLAFPNEVDVMNDDNCVGIFL